MLRGFRRQALVTLFAVMIALPGLATGPGRDGERHRVPDRAFDVLERASLRTPVEVRGLPLQHGLVETVLVQEFELLAPDARFHVTDEEGNTRIEPFPRMRFFKGEVLGKPGSWAVFTQSEQGLGGLITVDDEVFAVEQEAGSYLPRYYTRRVDDDEVPEAIRNWSCEADKYRVPEIHRERVATAATSTGPVTGHAFATSTKRRLRIAIDTDGELTSLVGGTGNVATYVAAATAAVSVLYEADLNTVISLGDVFSYANSGADPWTTSTSNSTLLGELGTYWHNTAARSLANVPRSTVLLISGKNTGGGVAWLGVLCMNSDFEFETGKWGGGYGMWGSVTGVVSTNPLSASYWDVLAYAHELGHNANSDHTHCIPSTSYGRTFVDLCRSGEAAECWNGAQSVPIEKGTIMSYCHLLSGGYPNVRLIFGKAGEASEAVLPPMTTHINSVTLTGTMSSGAQNVTANSTGNTASITAAGATSYVWEVTNGTITGGQGTSSITYTAGSSGQVTIKVTASNAKGCGLVATGTVDITGGAATPGDANGDGKADIFWRNQSSGVNAIWLMNGGTLSGGALLPSVVDNNMFMEGFGDFNGDGKTDILWRNISTGVNAVWLMNGTAIMSGAFLPTIADQDMHIMGVGDFNGDNKADVLWRNTATGDPAIWLMNGTTVASGALLPNVSTSLQIQAIGDLNNDNYDDIIFRNPSTGDNAVWFMTGTTVALGSALPNVPGSTFNIAGCADFDGDGRDDIFWRDSSSGVNAIWIMNSFAVSSGAVLPTIAPPMYGGAFADFNGDGKADIAFRNNSSGVNAMWMMNGTSIMSGAFLPSVADTGMSIEGPW